MKSMNETGATSEGAATRRWIEQFVVGENLCPFAAPVLRDELLRIVVCDSADELVQVRMLLREFDRLQSTPEEELATTIVVYPAGLTEFDDYLDFLAIAEHLLDEAALEGVIQIASFHPDYCFENVTADDVSNYTNRSPYPMLHLLREDMLERALRNFPHAEDIPQRNVERMRELGVEHIRRVLTQIRSDR